jgi:hypothetical protein
MTALRSFEIVEPLNQTTRRHIPEDLNRYCQRCDNVVSRMLLKQCRKLAGGLFYVSGGFLKFGPMHLIAANLIIFISR